MTMTETLMSGLPLANGVALEYAAAVALKGAVLLALTGLLTLVLGRCSAALRHFLWTLGIVGVLALPLISAPLPWSWEVLPDLNVVAWRGVMERAVDAEPEDAAPVDRRPGTAIVAEPSEDAGVWRAAQTVASPGPVWDGSAGTDAPAPASVAGGGALEPPRAGPAPRVVAVLGWAVVALLLALHHLAGRVALARIRRGAYPVRGPRALRALQAAARAAGVLRPVRLLVSGRTRVPMTWGVRRPVVLLPEDWHGWNDERLRLVLQHEVAHVRRFDALTDTLARVACALYWFNPLVWWAAARLRAESEKASDDLVLRGGARASEYAGHLLELVTHLGPRAAPVGALPLAQRSQFEGRLLAILDPARERNGVRRGVACVLCAGLIGAVVILAAVAPAGAATHEVVAGSSDGQETETEDVVRAPGTAPASERAPGNVVPSSSGRTAAAGAATGDPAGQEARQSSPAVSPSLSGAAAEPGNASGEVERSDEERVAAATRAWRNETGLLSMALEDGQVVDSTSIRALARALREDADEEVRRTAAWALGQIEDPAATAALAEAVRGDASAEVRATAAWALGQIEDPAAASALGEALSDEDAEVRRTALWALGQIESPEAVGPLARALGDADPEVRSTAAWALGQIESREAVAPLAAAIADEDVGVREQVVWALGQIESAEAVEPLGRALRDAEPQVRRQAAWALGQIESEAAVDALSTALQGDDDVEVRRQAAWALGQIESEAAVPALAAALADADSEVARQSAWALGQVEPSSAPPELIEVARTGSGELRSTALWALVQIEDPAAVPALVAALEDQDPDIRTRALRGLAEIRDEAAIRAIAELLQDANPEVRAAAARALAGRGGWDIDPNPNPNPNPNPRPWPQPRPNGG
jgi:HEAT repeat protein/beta-lactamase regulating signal transducer with metallopeptidase domain